MEFSGLEAHWPHRLEACATGGLTKVESSTATV